MTHLQVRLLAGFSLLTTQMTRTHTRVCLFPFLASVDIAAYLWGQIAQKPQIWGVNRRFSTKCAKY